MDSKESKKLSPTERKAYRKENKTPLYPAQADKKFVMGKETAEFGGANLSRMEQENKATVAAGDAVRARLVAKYNSQNTSPNSNPDPYTPNYKVGGSMMKKKMKDGGKPIK
jgi:hypothetical protein